MGLHKGQTGNPNGRPKGSPNKVTAELRKWIYGLLADNREQIVCDLQKVSPEQRLAIYVVGYAVPKMESEDYYAKIERLLANPDAD